MYGHESSSRENAFVMGIRAYLESRLKQVTVGKEEWKKGKKERKKEEADWTVKWKRLRGVVFDVECVAVSLEFKSNPSRAVDTSSGNTKKIHRELIGPVSSNLTSFTLFFSFFSTRYSSRKRTSLLEFSKTYEQIFEPTDRLTKYT